MKKISIFLMLLGIGLGPLSLYAIKDAEFYKKEYSPLPDNIKNQLDQLTDGQKSTFQLPGQCRNSDCSVYTLDDLPGFFIKEEMDRLQVATRFREVIDQRKLNLLMVPDKWPYCNEAGCVVIAQSVDIVDKPFNVEQIRQLAMLVIETGFFDAHAGNVRNLRNGQVALIDTEKRGIFALEKIHGLYAMQSHLSMDKYAAEYLEQKIKSECIKDSLWFKVNHLISRVAKIVKNAIRVI